jgi:formamidopyrimidine-DNA glycosylase
MPEMPELENYRKLISEQILNVPITNVRVFKENCVNLEGDILASELKNAKVIFVERRGRFLNFHLDNGRRLLVNLMVGGYMYYGKQEDLPYHSIQVEISFGESTLYFILPRTGYVHLLSARETGEVLGQLGPEISDRRMDNDRFVKMVKVRRGALKTLLVNQSVIAGIGNRYADEIAFKAQILPSAKVQDLDTEAMEKLYNSMKIVLSDAVEAGGSINMPFVNEDRHTGSYKLQVYNREGELCTQCNGIIAKVELNGRKAFFCPTCQHG